MKLGRLSRRIVRPGTVPYVILSPAVLLLVLVAIVPFALSIYYSVNHYRLSDPEHYFVGLQTYWTILTSASFWHSLQVTWVYALATVIVEAFLGVVFGLLLNTEYFLARTLRVLIILPLAVAPILSTLMWKLMMSPKFGILNYGLSFFGQRDFAWAGESATAMATVVLVDVWVFTPFIALLVFAAVRGMPQAPLEAAKVDGASGWFVFRNITVPYMLPYLLIAVTFRLIDSLRAFDIIYGMTKGGPGDTLMNLQAAAYTKAFVYTDIAQGSAYMLINWIMIYVISSFLIKYWRKSQDRLS